jgi:hypothetical protein
MQAAVSRYQDSYELFQSYVGVTGTRNKQMNKTIGNIEIFVIYKIINKSGWISQNNSKRDNFL